MKEDYLIGVPGAAATASPAAREALISAKTQSASWGADPQRVAAIGFSAGADLLRVFPMWSDWTSITLMSNCTPFEYLVEDTPRQ